MTICGVTIPLPEEHRFGKDRRGRRQWYCRMRDVPEQISESDRATVDGQSVRVLVTAEEERSITIAELLRRRDEERRNLKYTTEKLRLAEKRLQELGYVEPTNS